MKANRTNFKAHQRKTGALLRERLKSHVHYCAMVATPHGFVHLVRPNRTRFERIFWIICIVLVAIPCVLIIRQAWNRYAYAPTVSALLRDYQMWKHTFPATTICPAMISIQNVEDLTDYWDPIREFLEERGYERELYHATNETFQTDERKAETKEVIEFLNALLYGNLSTYGNLHKYKEKFGGIDPEDYLTLNNMTARVWSEPPDPEDRRWALDQTITEYGVCYSINSMLANYSTIERFRNNDMSMAGPFTTDEVQAFEEDPYLHVAGIQMATKVFVHSYNEIITNRDKSSFVAEQMALSLILVAEKHTVKEDVRDLSITQRHCRFPEESNLRYFPIYSYNLCRLECKMYWAMQFCRCFPFYYRRLYGEKVCDIDGMICLSKYEHELTMLKNKTSDESLCARCEINCEIEMIDEISKQLMLFMFSAQVEISLNLMTPTRIQTATMYSSTDFLVQIGGLVGLAYGIGILSAVEFLYFFTLRLYFAVVHGRLVKV